MERKEIIFSILLTVTCIFFIVFLVRKNIEPHAYMGDFPPKNYQNKSSREKEHHDIHTAWGDMGYYPNKRNEYEYDGSDSSRTSDIVKAQAKAERIRMEAEAEQIRMQSEIAGMKSKAEQLRLQAIEAEKTRSKIEQEKYAADADLKLSVINLSSALKELKQSSGDDIEFARANAEEMNTENKMLKQKLADLETAEAEALAAAAKASADAKAAQEEADATAAAAAAKAQEEADATAAAIKAQEEAAQAAMAAATAATDKAAADKAAADKAAADKAAADKAAAAKKSNLSSGKYSLKGGQSGKYCADEEHKKRINCDRGKMRDWEKFYIQNLGDNKYAIRGGKKNRWCRDKGDGIVCDSAWFLTPETQFTIEKHGTKYAIKSGKSGKYCADEVQNKRIICDRGKIGDWEKFTITKTL